MRALCSSTHSQATFQVLCVALAALALLTALDNSRTAIAMQKLGLTLRLSSQSAVALQVLNLLVVQLASRNVQSNASCLLMSSSP